MICWEERIMAGNLPFSEKLGSEIGPEERWFSAAAGACLVGYGLSRVSLRTLVAMAAGGYLVYRGSTGKCPLGDKLSVASEKLTNSYQTLAERAQSCCGTARGDQSSFNVSEMASESRDAVDPVDEAAMESFPASDPPSYSTGTAAPSQPIQ
jgi:hypothetical protein